MVSEVDMHMAEAFLSGRLSILDLRHEQYTPMHRLMAALALMASHPGHYYADEDGRATTSEESLFTTLRTFYPADTQAHKVRLAGYDGRVFRIIGGVYVVTIFWPEGLKELVDRYANQTDGGVAKWSEHLVAERAQQLMVAFRGETPAVQAEFKRLLDLG